LRGKAKAPVTLGQALPGVMWCGEVPHLGTAGPYGAKYKGHSVLAIGVNGVRFGTVDMTQRNKVGWSSVLGKVRISSGLVMLRVELVSGSLDLYSLRVRRA
jgi:hypothetical protein